MRTVTLRLIGRAPEGRWVRGELVAHRATHDTRHPRYYVYRGERNGVLTLERLLVDEERKLMHLGRELKVPVARRDEFMLILRMMVVPR